MSFNMVISSFRRDGKPKPGTLGTAVFAAMLLCINSAPAQTTSPVSAATTLPAGSSSPSITPEEDQGNTLDQIVITRHVLVLNSYHDGYSWSDAEMQGITDIMGREASIEVHIEYMDTKRCQDASYLRQLADIYKHKYSKVRPRIILAADNDAMDFLRQYRKSLFPGIPVVFLGINDYEDSMIAGMSPITGVIEEADYAGTIELALQLRPKARRVVVISDHTTTGQAHESAVRKIVPKFSDRVAFEHLCLGDMTFSQLLSKLKNLNDESVVILLSHFTDKEGRRYSQQQSLELIVRNSGAPVFVVTDSRVNQGVVGGHVVNGYQQGRLAGEIALRIVHGEKADRIPVIRQSPNAYMFDFAGLAHWDISQAKLPPESIVLNKPVTFYENHSYVIWTTTIIIIVLSVAVVVLTGNILRRRQAEEAVVESERRFRLLFNTINDAIYVYEGPGENNLPGKIMEVNEAACHRMGYTRDELLEMNMLMLGSPEIRERVPAIMQELRKQGHIRWEGVHITKQGQKIPVEIVNRLFTLRGRQLVLSTARDITERKRAEEERHKLEEKILQTQKMESLGVLAGGIAHDFNNLLTSIVGYADLAMHDLSPLSPARETVSLLMASARRATDLTKQMLAYSGKGKFVIEVVQLSAVVEEMTHLLEVSISKKCVLKYHFAHELPPVEVDVTQLRQVIMNLIINASEAIGDRSGVIAITTGAMECDDRYLAESYLDEDLPAGFYVYLEVSDTGCGMDAQTRARIFDPFFSTKFTGRGLGLAAVLGIIRGHKGAIKVYSEVGKGTTFKVLLPAANAPVKPADTSPAEPAPWHGEGMILLADDEETVRALSKRMLETLGFTVVLAGDGRQAVDVFQQNADKISAVLLDMTMPHMDGQQAFTELRRIRPNIKVILSSGYSEQDAVERFAGKGLSGFLQKPYGLEELSQAMRKLTENP